MTFMLLPGTSLSTTKALMVSAATADAKIGEMGLRERRLVSYGTDQLCYDRSGGSAFHFIPARPV